MAPEGAGVDQAEYLLKRRPDSVDSRMVKVGHDHSVSSHGHVGPVWRAVATAILVALGLTFSAPALAATPDLASVVLPEAVPGLVVSAPGATNGPINQSNVGVLGRSPSQVAAVQQQLANGDLSGYIRIWSRQVPQNGDTAVILALNITNSSGVGSFLGGLNHGISSVASESFDVPDIAGASGFTDHLPLSGQPATEYAVTFARGSTVFEVEVATITGDITVNDALSVASLQAARDPGSVQSPTTPAATGSSPTGSTQDASYVLGEVAFCVLVAILIVYLIQRDRRKRSKTPTAPSGNSGFPRMPEPAWPVPIPATPTSLQPLGPQPFGSRKMQTGQDSFSGLPLLPTFAPTPPPVSPPGWYPDSNDPTLQRYFDGHSWTSHTAPR